MWRLGNVRLSRLTLRWMFETAVGDSAKQLRLQQKVAKSGGVDTDVTALLVDIAGGSGGVTFLAVGLSCLILVVVKLVVGIVDEILLGRHGGGVND